MAKTCLIRHGSKKTFDTFYNTVIFQFPFMKNNFICKFQKFLIKEKQVKPNINIRCLRCGLKNMANFPQTKKAFIFSRNNNWSNNWVSLYITYVCIRNKKFLLPFHAQNGVRPISNAFESLNGANFLKTFYAKCLPRKKYKKVFNSN